MEYESQSEAYRLLDKANYTAQRPQETLTAQGQHIDQPERTSRKKKSAQGQHICQLGAVYNSAQGQHIGHLGAVYKSTQGQHIGQPPAGKTSASVNHTTRTGASPQEDRTV